MAVESLTIEMQTKGHADVLDITSEVAQALRESSLSNGTATIFSPSSTSALTTLEFESGCVSDLKRLFDEIIDPHREFAHNARWGDGNGHSHVRSALLGTSFTVPFIEKRLTLGTWQQIIYIDFDNRSRQRKLIIQLIGE
jgi:secondary thiamine-phosphate synthase enzyme